ncbi:MAG: sigma 54-interacting transcriptional regulator, partial [Deltaproteobacteria bacterium]|nr:sigma 54-interacting transcriptional regulator [Deltaproteobacteria bacterium]
HMTLHQMQQGLEQLVDERTFELSKIRDRLEHKFRELRVSEERYELALTGSAAGIWDWDLRTDKLYYSDRFKELLGYAPDEFLDTLDEFWNRLHPDDYEAVRMALDQHLMERAPYTIDFCLQTKSGEYRWFHARGQAQWDETGQPTRMSGSITDITPRKKAEEEILSGEERFRSLIEQSPMPIEILSLDGKILQSNPSWNKLWGVDEVGAAETMEKYNMLTDPQIKKLGINHLVEKAFSGEYIILPPIIYDAIETAEDFEIENIVGLKSPWIQCHLYPIKDINGKVVNIINTYVDLSDQKNAEAELQNAYEEIKNLKEQLEAESAYLQDEIKLEHNFENIIGQSEALKYVLNRVEQVAAMDSPVLLMGETGTGKELMARALHKLSPYGKRALVKVNCAALPRELIESELFGREKGAFTGATTTQPGRFELAKGSTLFLDEIGELPFELQAKLLRVLESGEFERLGSSRTLRSDARIVAATNRVLEEEVRKGRFREDLWYRLKVFPITVPPLRQRPEDIPMLVKWFVIQLSRKMGKRITEIPKHAMQKLQRYPWPGNVRELKHTVESTLIAAQGQKLDFDLPQAESTVITDFKSFEEMERDYILQVLKAKNWKIGGKDSAASILGMPPSTLRSRMKKLGLKKP